MSTVKFEKGDLPNTSIERGHHVSEKPIFIRRASQLITLQGFSEKPATGKNMERLSILENGSLWIEHGKIEKVGRDEAVCRAYRDRLDEARVIEAAGKTVTPGLIDPHTHFVYAGSREHELHMRLKGKTYMEIMQAGGGIHATTKATGEADFSVIYKESYKRLNQFLKHGVTTVESKSGYGLDLDRELKQLEVAHRLDENHPIDLVHTFMGAHAVPEQYKTRPDDYVRQIIEYMLPVIAERQLAEFNDVFCEKGVFTPAQAERILEAGKKYGLQPKIHADEIEPYGGAELAARIGAVSADHLLKTSEEGVEKLAQAGVIAVLLPGTAFFLMTEAANARRFIDRGVAVALSTDCNPGSSPTVSLPFIMNLGCLHMGMTPAEVVTATTINAAHAVGRNQEIGSLEAGKKADVVIFSVPNYELLQYHYAMNHVQTVIKNGRVVLENGKSDAETEVSV